MRLGSEGAFMSRSPLQASGVPSHWGPMGEFAKHASELPSLRDKELGYLFTNLHLLLIEGCF